MIFDDVADNAATSLLTAKAKGLIRVSRVDSMACDIRDWISDGI
jgi:hypothetical protein